MATVKQSLAHPEDRNWLKAAKALQFAKEGIEKFVENEVIKVQLDILNEVWRVTGLPVGTTCQTCTTENVTWRNLPCPVGICQKIRDEIKDHHRKHKPAYGNTDAQKWSSIGNSWEMAKCFMPPGYPSMSPASSDFSGLINVVINLNDFKNLIQDDLSKPNNICSQARTTRNIILHSPTQKITDADFISYIDILINLLSDTKTLAKYQHAQDAISKLQQVKTETFTVSEEDKTKLLAEAQKAKQEIHEEGSKQRKQVRQEGQDAVKGIHETGSQQTKQVHQEGQDAVNGIHEEGSQQTKQVHQEGQAAVKGIHEEGSQQTKQVRQEGQDAVKGIHEEGSQQTKQVRQEGQDAVKGIHEEGSQQTKQVHQEGQAVVKGIHKEGSQQRKQVHQEGQDAVNGIHEEGSQQTKQVRQEGQDAVKGIHEEGSQQTKQVRQEGQDAVKGIHEEGSQQTKQVHQEGQAAVKGIHEEGSQQTKQVRQEGQDAVKGIHEEGSQQTKQVRQEGQDAVKGIHEEGSQQTKQVHQEGQAAVKGIHEEGSQQTKQVRQEGQAAVKGIHEEGSQQRKQVHQEGQAAVKGIHKQGSQQTKQVREEGLKAIDEMKKKKEEMFDNEGQTEYTSKQGYSKGKQDLKTKLIEVYQGCMVNVPISPLMPDEDVCTIKDLYAEPTMEIVKQPQTKQEEKEMITSYHEIFHNNSDLCKKIYIIGDGGIGKSSLCQNIVDSWCKAHSKPENSTRSLSENRTQSLSENRTQSPSENQQTMFKFDFLFYIPLRQALAYYKVEEMIKQILLQGKHNDLICKVLEDDTLNNLIILDGLDEWKPPTGCQKSALVNERLPDRIITNKCSILTTSRPWKMDGIKASEIDRQIKVTGLSPKTSETFIKKTVDVLNEHHKAAKSPKEFGVVIEKRNLDPFRYIPVMLMQLIGLWFDGKNIGDTKCQIYSSMIDLQFKRTENKLKDKKDFMKMKEKHTKSQSKLPECFNGQTNCSQFVGLLYSISKMAFEALLNTNLESSLVFDSRAVKSYGLSETQLDICFKVGILSKTKVIKGCTTQLTSYSFLHKSFQEFFAALYICMSGDDTDKHLKQMFSICDSLDVVLEMENVFVFTSGLIPHVAVRLSEHICNVCSGDSRVQQYRQNAEYLIWHDAARRLENVQSVIVECARESSNTGLRIDDIVLFVFGKNTQPELLANFNLTNIKTLNIHCVDCNIQRCLIPTLMEAEALQKVVFYNVPVDPAVNDMIHHVVNKSNKTLKSVIFSYVKPPLQPFITMLESLQQLEAIHLSNINLPHDSYTKLMAFLSERTQLRQIELVEVYCFKYDKHHLDLSQHTQLQSLTAWTSSFIIANVNTINLEKCEIDGCAVSADILPNCPKLQYLQYQSFNDSNIDALFTIIPILIHLKYFELWHAMIGNKSLQLSSEMKTLENVTLLGIIMTREAFHNFVDSIPTTHKSVAVNLFYCKILNPTTKNAEAEAETAAAWDYIRTSHRFDVIMDIKHALTFIVKPDKEDH